MFWLQKSISPCILTWWRAEREAKLCCVSSYKGINTIIRALMIVWHTSEIITHDFPFAHFASLPLSFSNIWIPHVSSYNLSRSFALSREFVFYQLNLTILMQLHPKLNFIIKKKRYATINPLRPNR